MPRQPISSQPIHTDNGSVLQPEESALVVDADGELRFLFAEYPNEVPQMALLLGAILVKSSEPEWVEALIGEVYRNS